MSSFLCDMSSVVMMSSVFLTCEQCMSHRPLLQHCTRIKVECTVVHIVCGLSLPNFSHCAASIRAICVYHTTTMPSSVLSFGNFFLPLLSFPLSLSIPSCSDQPSAPTLSPQVSTAVRLCDGALVAVDVVEGVCPQTHVVLKQVRQDRLNLCVHACMSVYMRACVPLCMCVCAHARVCACMHVCVHACMSAYMRACLRTCVHASLCACVCVLVGGWVCMCTCVCACFCVSLCVRTHVRVSECIRMCVSLCVHTCVWLWLFYVCVFGVGGWVDRCLCGCMYVRTYIHMSR